MFSLRLTVGKPQRSVNGAYVMRAKSRMWLGYGNYGKMTAFQWKTMQNEWIQVDNTHVFEIKS